MNDIVVMTEIYGVNDENRRQVFVNTRHLVKFNEATLWERDRSNHKGARVSHIYMADGSVLKVTEEPEQLASYLMNIHPRDIQTIGEMVPARREKVAA